MADGLVSSSSCCLRYWDRKGSLTRFDFVRHSLLSLDSLAEESLVTLTDGLEVDRIMLLDEDEPDDREVIDGDCRIVDTLMTERGVYFRRKQL